MNGTYSQRAVILSSLLFLQPAFADTPTKTLYDLNKAASFQSNLTGNYYIQLGSFFNQSNAKQLLDATQLKTKRPLQLQEHNGKYSVMLGPMHTSADVRAASHELSSTLSPVQKSTFKPIIMPTLDHWFISGGLGVQNANIADSLSVSNGSGYPAPLNKDTLSTQSNAAALLALEAGYRWQQETQWLPAYSLSLYYNHLFQTNMGEQITQYALPQFRNYNYQWKVSSDALFASLKLNLFKYNELLPYVKGGLGVAFNHASDYSETALPGITPRVSPGFSNQTNTQFAYKVGAGVDWNVYPQWILSVGYEFQSLGLVNSGNGVNTWSADRLQTPTYQTNLALLSITYLY